MAERWDLDRLTQEWTARGLNRRDLMRLVGTGAGGAAIMTLLGANPRGVAVVAPALVADGWREAAGAEDRDGGSMAEAPVVVAKTDVTTACELATCPVSHTAPNAINKTATMIPASTNTGRMRTQTFSSIGGTLET